MDFGHRFSFQTMGFFAVGGGYSAPMRTSQKLRHGS
jgi:hypothetical protein